MRMRALEPSSVYTTPLRLAAGAFALLLAYGGWSAAGRLFTGGDHVELAGPKSSSVQQHNRTAQVPKTVQGPRTPQLMHGKEDWGCCFNATDSLTPPACCDPHMLEPRWLACHKEHVALVAAEDKKKGFPLLFLGDSITEFWMGRNRCGPEAKATDVPPIFQKHFGKYHAGVMAVSADQAKHLLWRLQHGQAPSVHPPEAVVLMIGTNDLGAAVMGTPPKPDAKVEAAISERSLTAAHGVLEVLYFVRSRWPSAHIILLGLLPRGCEPFFACKPAAGSGIDFAWPSVFAPGIDAVNTLLQEYAMLDPAHLHYLDCGRRFLNSDGTAVDKLLMPDALHPNAAGYDLLGQCLEPLLTKLMKPQR